MHRTQARRMVLLTSALLVIEALVFALVQSAPR